MSPPLYVGIENEFQAFDALKWSPEPLDFKTLWPGLLKKYPPTYHKLSDTAIRTRMGNGMYVDEHDPEICTPPVRVQPGFTQQAYDTLYLARRELLRFIYSDQDIRVIGHSTHWNMSNPGGTDYSADHFGFELFYALAVPYALFMLTPHSVGSNVRVKNNGSRIELLGDYIESEDQIKAFLLFSVSSAVYFHEHGLKSLPLSLGMRTLFKNRENDESQYYPNLVHDGRYTDVPVVAHRHKKSITAQTYLEAVFHFFKKRQAFIGTPEEIQNLEDFVTGRKKLEIDDFKEHAVRTSYKHGGELSFSPSFALDPWAYHDERPLPTVLADFLGDLAQPHGGSESGPYLPSSVQVERLAWDYVKFRYASSRHSTGYFEANGVGSIDMLAEFLLRTPRNQRTQIFRWNNRALAQPALAGFLKNLKEIYPSPHERRTFYNLSGPAFERLCAAYEQVYASLPPNIQPASPSPPASFLGQLTKLERKNRAALERDPLLSFEEYCKSHKKRKDRK
ncbi:MAG: hypothetical protein Q7R76_00235 [Candidatus Woesearchaeota archaeon]|nr:hypothetical protein [Candidatus Woesearchaeota archaeon]